MVSCFLAFTMEQDITDYDMDSEDERWLVSQAQRLELDPGKFEEMMDRLEKSSGQTVVTLHEAKALLKEDDDLIIAVYDYWLNKRLRLVRKFFKTSTVSKFVCGGVVLKFKVNTITCIAVSFFLAYRTQEN